MPSPLLPPSRSTSPYLTHYRQNRLIQGSSRTPEVTGGRNANAQPTTKTPSFRPRWSLTGSKRNSESMLLDGDEDDAEGRIRSSKILKRDTSPRVEGWDQPTLSTPCAAIQSATDGTWLNSTCIDLVLKTLFCDAGSMVLESKWADPQSFWPDAKLRWPSATKTLILPICRNKHWTVAFLGLESGNIDWYDSMKSLAKDHGDAIREAIHTFTTWLLHHNLSKLDQDQWTFRVQVGLAALDFTSDH